MQKVDKNFFESILTARPVGSQANIELQRRLAVLGRDLGSDVEELPFSCSSWQRGPSRLDADDLTFEILPSPFSPAATGTGELLFISNVEKLRATPIEGKIVILHGEIAAEPIAPKNFPFYEVAEHLEIISLLENGRPLAVLSAMGKHPMCGLDPCPMFEDCHFHIPSAYFPAAMLPMLLSHESGRVYIDSITSPSSGAQLILHKPAAIETFDTVILCGHMDTAYDTPGALDNGVGLYVILMVLERLAGESLPFHLQVVPFNGEDYSEVSGELAYLSRYPVDVKNTRLVINIDDAGHKGSQNALSFYNIPPHMDMAIDRLISHDPLICRGEPWYASDHTMFAARGVPCLAFASSDLMAETTLITHTAQDTMDQVDFVLADNMVDTICLFLKNL